MATEPVGFDDGMRVETRRQLIERGAAADRRLKRMRKAAPILIAVSVLALLASIAVPNFLMFNCRARQSEPKSSLPAYRDHVMSGDAPAFKLTARVLRYRYGALTDDDGRVTVVAVGNPYNRGPDVWLLTPDAKFPRNVLNVCSD